MPQGLSFRVKRRRGLHELSLETRQVMATFDELCRSAREIERLLELPNAELLPLHSTNLQGEELASLERSRLNIGDRPIQDIRQLVESQGILCFHLPIPNGEFSGLSWDHPGYGACILINGSENPGRRAFTTAHEYAHLLKRDGDSVCDLQMDRGAEHEANRFATVFLMPAADVMNTFHRRHEPGEYIGVEQIASLARRYTASLEAMCLRLEELKLVPQGTANALDLGRPPSRYYGRARPKWRRRVGETFAERALEAYSVGRISAGKLARHLGIDIRQAIDLVEEEREHRRQDG
jgi:Zn-dependent peptidase ImmA (M78 family)